MSTAKQHYAVQNRQQQISRINRPQMQWLLRGLLVIGRQPRSCETGFVLPTVAMVSMVVVLLTTAILLRSFDRSKNASNVRVNQAVLNATTPALDRARAKIDKLFKSTMSQATPSDIALDNALTGNNYTFGDETRLKLVHDIDKNGSIQRNTSRIEDKETLTTAWKFPVDTDNNGLFDSFTLYGIYFRSPTRSADGKFNRARNPLEGRTPPMNEGTSTGVCGAARATSATVGNDWYKSGNKLKKSFFVYTATVPITAIGSLNRNQYEQYQGNKSFFALEFQQDRVRIPLNNNAVWYEDDIEVSNANTIKINGRLFTNSNLMVAGNTSSNRTIFYQISDPDSCYYEQENSKIVVGGNIANGDVRLTTDDGQVEVHRFQGKGTAPAGQDNTDDGISSTNKTTTLTGGRWVGYNNKAYTERIRLMVQAALDLHITREKPTIASVSEVVRYPQEVKERFQQRFNDPNETKEPWNILTEELETYFKQYTRRVPYAEVDSTNNSVTALSGYSRANVLGSTNPIRPPETWMAIEEPTSNSTNGYTNLPLNFSNNTMNLRATEPTQQQKEGKEHFIGDRILFGNNLPFFWPKYITTGIFDEFAEPQEEQLVTNGSSAVHWNNPSNGNATNIQRTRQSQIQLLPDFGSVERDGFWETEAAMQPAANENTGGLRVITGAGVYIDGVATASGGTGERTTDGDAKESFLPNPALNPGVSDPPKFTTAAFTTNNDNIIVWSDSMPMWNGSNKGDLQMRATAVYHHQQVDSTTEPGRVDPNQPLIACVSSYYDPTDQTTARNLSELPDVSGISDTNGDGTINISDKLADGSTPTAANNGQSNNGVTYSAPYTNDTGRISAVNTYRDKLNRQARAIFPNGRIVNVSLRKALIKIDDTNPTKPRSLADNAAIDTTICALKILDGTLNVQTSPNVPHGAIKEAAFLDGRQVKSLNSYIAQDNALDNTKIAETPANLTDRYTLPLEQRQPLEIRVTELDLNLLRNQEIRKQIGTPINSSDNAPANNQEYLLPNSGIIYATRDDALPDLSDSSDATTQALVSPTDFKLDSTRRPNGIRLINGSNLARKNFYRVAEKGLILATNLPAYIKGDFNLHKDPNSDNLREEFTDKLEESDWSDFYTRSNTLDQNFACRQNQPGCADTGDQWRPATIISDAQTLLSNNFWDGFRNQGDYDLNNNQGNTAVEARLKNGFWNNNFVTSANWVGSDGFPDSTSKNSYLANGVTPIQRRANFPEYVMEICRKLPVSECNSRDWVVGYDANDNGVLEENEKATPGQPKYEVDRLGAGTTARPALQPEDRRYARRVAFQRRDSGALEATTWPNDQVTTPIPLGINANSQVELFPYLVGNNLPNPNVPRLVDNALWFRTTNNTSGKPFCDGNNNPASSGCTSDDRSYANDKPLYYDDSTKLFLPPTPEIPDVRSLNLPDDNPASGYAICTQSGSSKKALISSAPSTNTLEAGNCDSEPGNPLNAIEVTLNDLLALNPDDSSTEEIVTPDETYTGNTPFEAGQTTTFTQTGRVNVIDLGSGDQTLGTSETATTINLVGNEDTVFVFKKSSGSLNFGDPKNNKYKGVVVQLQGVDPNNVFWALNGNIQWHRVTDSHKMKGTFISNGTVPNVTNVEIEGRLLGVNSLPSGFPKNTTNTTIKAIASTRQPSLAPVLQIHSPTGTPGSSPFAGSLENNWLQVATTTTANAVFVTGDSPSRPSSSETGGGLHNLVRFLENWSGQIARISGSFIQHKKSFYGSAPFNSVDPAAVDSASLFYTLDSSRRAPYRNSSDTGFRYRGGASEHRTSFFMPPNLAYIFDVALLSQSPDLLAQTFTLNSTFRPMEYFREVGRDDPWLQTLLCAAQGSGTNYTYAVDSSERPTDCPSPTSYNDEQSVSDSVTGGGL